MIPVAKRMFDVTVIGSVKRRQALTRAGARAGDELYVSGTIGTAGAGLQMLKSKLSTTEDTEDTEVQSFRSDCSSVSSTPSVVESFTIRTRTVLQF